MWYTVLATPLCMRLRQIFVRRVRNSKILPNKILTVKPGREPKWESTT